MSVNCALDIKNEARANPGAGLCIVLSLEYAGLAQAQQDTLGVGHGTRTEAGPGTPGDHRYAEGMALSQHGLHLLRGLRQHHQQRQFPVEGEGVALEGALGFRILHDGVSGEVAAQSAQQLAARNRCQRVTALAHRWTTMCRVPG